MTWVSVSELMNWLHSLCEGCYPLCLEEQAKEYQSIVCVFDFFAGAFASHAQVFQDLLWSDPQEKLGWEANPRGAGVKCRPEIGTGLCT